MLIVIDDNLYEIRPYCRKKERTIPNIRMEMMHRKSKLFVFKIIQNFVHKLMYNNNGDL